MTYCIKCGTAINPGAKFCSSCGEQQPDAPQVVAPAPPPPPPLAPPEPQASAPPAVQAPAPPPPVPAPAPPAVQAPAPPPVPIPAPPPPGAPTQPSAAPPPLPPQYATPPQYAPPPQKEHAILSVMGMLKGAFAFLMKKPILLWGISLMFTLVSTLIAIFGVTMPIIIIPTSLVLSAGMSFVYLSGYRRQPLQSAMIFTGFNETKRVAGGMLWQQLWIIIWFMIPIVGLVIGIIKSYAYRFVPYILMTRPDVSPTEALKKSIELTTGYKGKMFLVDLLIWIGAAVVILIFGLLAQVAGFFVFLLVVIVLILIAILPLAFGLISAAFFDEIEKVRK